MTEAKGHMHAHNAMLSELPIGKRKSRAKLFRELEAYLWAEGYRDADSRAEDGIQRAEHAQLNGGFKPADMHRAKIETGRIDGDYGWKPDLWVQKVARDFPIRRKIFDKKTLFEVKADNLYGMPYEILVIGDGDDVACLSVKSAAEVRLEAHNKKVLEQHPRTRKALVLSVVGEVGLSWKQADTLISVLEIAQLGGGLTEKLMEKLDVGPKLWGALRRYCPKSTGLIQWDRNSEMRLHCPYLISLGDDGISVCEMGV